MRKFIYNPEIFYERKDINEFLREHPFVGDLYDATLQSLYYLDYAKDEALNVFNQAYYICTLIIEKHVDRSAIIDHIRATGLENNRYLGLILMVAKCLLRVHQELVEFDPIIIRWLGVYIRERIDSSQFNHVVKNYAGNFDKVLNFSGKYVEVPVEEKNECDEPAKMIEKAQKLVASATDKLSSCNEEKDKRIKELEEQLALEREKNCTMAMRLNTLDKSIAALKLPASDEKSINNAINVHTIGEYACGLSNMDHATIISTMLSKLSNRAYLERNDMEVVNQVIEQIDNAQQKEPRVAIHCEKVVGQEIHNDNKDSQVFNGGITNSKFGK